MAQKDGLCVSAIAGYHTVHTQPPAMYDGAGISRAKSNFFAMLFF